PYTTLFRSQAGRLSFTTSLKEGLDHGEIIFLALPTPEDGDGSADLRYVLGVSDEIGKLITEYKVIVDKSTVPVGTADKVRETIRSEERRVGKECRTKKTREDEIIKVRR